MRGAHDPQVGAQAPSIYQCLFAVGVDMAGALKSAIPSHPKINPSTQASTHLQLLPASPRKQLPKGKGPTTKFFSLSASGWLFQNLSFGLPPDCVCCPQHSPPTTINHQPSTRPSLFSRRSWIDYFLGLASNAQLVSFPQSACAETKSRAGRHPLPHPSPIPPPSFEASGAVRTCHDVHPSQFSLLDTQTKGNPRRPRKTSDPNSQDKTPWQEQVPRAALCHGRSSMPLCNGCDRGARHGA